VSPTTRPFTPSKNTSTPMQHRCTRTVEEATTDISEPSSRQPDMLPSDQCLLFHLPSRTHDNSPGRHTARGKSHDQTKLRSKRQRISGLQHPATSPQTTDHQNVRHPIPIRTGIRRSGICKCVGQTNDGIPLRYLLRYNAKRLDG
jgi:hypothetical protein